MRKISNSTLERSNRLEIKQFLLKLDFTKTKCFSLKSYN